MQRTRLNTLFDQITLKFRQWVFNPWRRLSIVIISLLFGNFFATAISATAGQTAKLDVTISAFLVLGVELISWLYYRFDAGSRSGPPLNGLDGGARAQFSGAQQLAAEQPAISLSGMEAGMEAESSVPLGVNRGPVRSRSTLAEALNAFKLGMIYGLFVEAFKLGS